MWIKQDYDFRDLENNCWGQATKILKEISDANKEDALMSYFEDVYYDDILTLTEVNDLLAFDWERLYEDIGMFNIEDKIDTRDLRKVQDVCDDYKKPRMITNSDLIAYSDLEDGSMSESDLSEQIEEITDKLGEISDKIDEVFDCESNDDFDSVSSEMEDLVDELDGLLVDYVDGSSKVYDVLYDDVYNVLDRMF